LYVIDPTHDPRGVAYATTNPEHLLNVRAGQMAAFDDDGEHFVRWLAGDGGKKAAAALGLQATYGAQDFVPRMLYGAYLEAIWHETQEIAVHKKLEIKLVPAQAVTLQTGAAPSVQTARGDAIAVDAIVLAVGHEVKPVLPQVVSPQIIQNPWATDALRGAAEWPSPVILIGTGLTAVDVVLSLRRAGYAGAIVAASFSGRLPQAHAATSAIFRFQEAEMARVKSLAQLVQLLRTKIREVGEWRVVIDALRPFTQSLWQRLSTPEQMKFLARLTTRWITHRHRMAPEIAARMDAEIAAQQFQMLGCKNIGASVENKVLSISVENKNAVHRLQPSHVINCAGLELNLAKSANPLLRQILALGLVEAHATGLGIVADKHCRAWGVLHPHLYVIGSLLTGQLLESTAVPELRAQAAGIAKTMLG
jgi:uncharacterized NAD(P)/FAD-binding protein YdhS